MYYNILRNYILNGVNVEIGRNNVSDTLKVSDT